MWVIKNTTLYFVVVVILFSVSFSFAYADTVVFQPNATYGKDAEISCSYPNDNFGNSSFFIENKW